MTMAYVTTITPPIMRTSSFRLSSAPLEVAFFNAVCALALYLVKSFVNFSISARAEAASAAETLNSAAAAAVLSSKLSWITVGHKAGSEMDEPPAIHSRA